MTPTASLLKEPITKDMRNPHHERLPARASNSVSKEQRPCLDRTDPCHQNPGLSPRRLKAQPRLLLVLKVLISFLYGQGEGDCQPTGNLVPIEAV